MDPVEINTTPTTIASDATRAAAVGAAQVVGSMVGIAVVLGAVYGADALKSKLTRKKTKNEED